MSLWQYIEEEIERKTGQSFHIERNQSVAGGDINMACRVSDGRREFFIKTNHAKHGGMFEAEAEGLLEMAATGTVRVPEPVCYGTRGQQCFVVMEYLDMGRRVDMRRFGQQLAAMHRVVESEFGWRIDNTIGATPQPNARCVDWIGFWQEHRLGFQLELARQNGYGAELLQPGERLLADMSVLFESYQPEASMLHGDLWSGNYGGLADAEPVIFDPAFYYGDREADLAMTTLFGGFGGDFYAAYNEAWPLDEGYSVRKTFYNVYHVINHANMFGGGYAAQAATMMQRVLAEI